MSVFDEVKCDYPLPWPEVAGATWTSHDTTAQYLDRYEIRADGTLWHWAYDLRVEITDAGPFGVWHHHDNCRWEQEFWNDKMEIHHETAGNWYVVLFWFRDGVVKDAIFKKVNLVEG